MAIGARSKRSTQAGARRERQVRELEARRRELERGRRRTSGVPPGIAVSRHLVDQWVTRVDSSASHQVAGLQIQRFLQGAGVMYVDPDGGLYLGHPYWPNHIVVIRPGRGVGWSARTVIPRPSLEQAG